MAILRDIIVAEAIERITRQPDIKTGRGTSWPIDQELLSSQDNLDKLLGKFKVPDKFNIHFGSMTADEFYTWFQRYAFDPDRPEKTSYGNEWGKSGGTISPYLTRKASISGQESDVQTYGLFKKRQIEKNKLIAWLRERFAFEPQPDMINIAITGNPDFADNDSFPGPGDPESPDTVPITLWGLAHRVAHTIIEYGDDKNMDVNGIYAAKVPDEYMDETANFMREFLAGRQMEHNNSRKFLHKLLGLKKKTFTKMTKKGMIDDGRFGDDDYLVAFLMSRGVDSIPTNQENAIDFTKNWFIADIMHKAFGSMLTGRDRDMQTNPGEGSMEFAAQLLVMGKITPRKYGDPVIDEFGKKYCEYIEELYRKIMADMVGKTYVL